MNQTTIVNNAITTMGGSGSSNPAYYSSAKSLNYSSGSNSLQNAYPQNLTAIPVSFKYQDTVGLFGAENIFVRVNMDIQSSGSVYTNNPNPSNDYYEVWTFPEDETINYYETGLFKFGVDKETVNTYLPARISNDLSRAADAYVQIDLDNLRTGNKYIDAWLDVRLYQPSGQEHPYDRMYLPLKSHFYIGFHARNTRRLPYNVQVDIGRNLYAYLEIPKSEQQYVVRPSY